MTRAILDHLAHALPDLLRWAAEDKLAGLSVQVFVAWITGGS